MRVILIVLDSVGVGELPDARAWGDDGVNTLGNLAKYVGGLVMPNLEKLGLGNIIPIKGVYEEEKPTGCFGKLKEQSQGKDTSTGHWEMMGVVTDVPFRVFPNGFPREVIKNFEKETGRKVLGNVPASGTEIIRTLGKKHLRTGNLIVYTSADSVFQIAAHEEIVPIDEQYRIAKIARKICDKYGITRVISRPFIGEYPNFVRTPNRKDFSVPPGGKTLLEYMEEQGVRVFGVGKASPIFNDIGFSANYKIKSNMHGVTVTIDLIKNKPQKKKAPQFIFANLVEFDSKFGHRRNPEGYADALEDFDSRIPELIEALDDEDILIITADHGNDPTAPGTDHTREYIPILVYGKYCNKGVDLGTRESFTDIAETVKEIYQIKAPHFGDSFLTEIVLKNSPLDKGSSKKNNPIFALGK